MGRQNDGGGGLSDPWLAAGGERRGHRPRPPDAHEETASRPRGVDVSCGPRQRSQGRAFAPPSLNSFVRRNGWRLLFNAVSCLRSTSIFDRHALDVVFLEIFAGGFRLVLVEAGEARTIIGRAALLDGLGEGFGAGEHLGRLGLDARETLLGGLLGGIGADLDDPAAAGLRLGGGRRARGGGGVGATRGGGSWVGCSGFVAATGAAAGAGGSALAAAAGAGGSDLAVAAGAGAGATTSGFAAAAGAGVGGSGFTAGTAAATV